MALIILRVCSGRSEALLVTHTTLLEISCRGSSVQIADKYYDYLYVTSFEVVTLKSYNYSCFRLKEDKTSIPCEMLNKTSFPGWFSLASRM